MRRRTYPTEQGLDLIEMGDEGLARLLDGDVSVDDVQFALAAFAAIKTKGARLCDVGDALAQALYGEPVSKQDRLGSGSAEAA